MRITFIGRDEFTGRTWGPRSVNEGIPGAAEACIHIASRLAERGHEVFVYVHAGAHAGRYGTLEWRDISTLPDFIDSDIVVLSETDIAHAIKTNGLIYLWMHCEVSSDTVIDFRKIHKLMPLSESSRSKYTQVDPSKFFVTRNGVDVTHFDKAVPRNPYKVVYGSDYDRGLWFLLSAWPRVRKAHPEAQLSIFYGWEIFDRKIELFSKENPAIERHWREAKRCIQAMMDQPGISHLGRISHDRVAEEFLSASVWAYPCTFQETSCITAMKAQVAGAIPVVFGTAALRETVRWGLRAPAYTDQQPQQERAAIFEAWTGGLIDMLGNQELQNRVRPQMMADSRQFFSWARVVEEWEQEFAQQRAGS